MQNIYGKYNRRSTEKANQIIDKRVEKRQIQTEQQSEFNDEEDVQNT